MRDVIARHGSHIKDVVGGKSYEFKVMKDGFRPGYAVIKEDDWYVSTRDGPTGVVASCGYRP